MLITKRSPVTGIEHSREIDVTPQQMQRWQNGELIQRAMPHLSADDREFLISGVTPEEWEQLTAEPDEDEPTYPPAEDVLYDSTNDGPYYEPIEDEE